MKKLNKWSYQPFNRTRLRISKIQIFTSYRETINQPKIIATRIHRQFNNIQTNKKLAAGMA